MNITPPLDSPEFDATRQELQAFLWQYSSDKATLVREEISFEAWWDELIDMGWNRAALYRLINEPLTKLHGSLAEHAIDLLKSCKSGLMLDDGATVETIYRLKGEPEDWVEFLRFVYSYDWLPK